MTEKEKLKEIIETVLGFHDYYKVVVTEKDIDRLTDKLIENGIRDITEKGVVAVEGEISIVPENFVADIKFALDGNVDELKRRAEVAERALEYAVSEYRCDECPCIECNAEIRGSLDCVDLIAKTYKEEAERDIEREIEEERK